jgi:hypothetical protein
MPDRVTSTPLPVRPGAPGRTGSAWCTHEKDQHIMATPDDSRQPSSRDHGPWWAAAVGGGGGITAAVLQDHAIAWAIVVAFAAWLAHNVIIAWLRGRTGKRSLGSSVASAAVTARHRGADCCGQRRPWEPRGSLTWPAVRRRGRVGGAPGLSGSNRAVAIAARRGGTGGAHGPAPRPDAVSAERGGASVPRCCMARQGQIIARRTGELAAGPGRGSGRGVVEPPEGNGRGCAGG